MDDECSKPGFTLDLIDIFFRSICEGVWDLAERLALLLGALSYCRWKIEADERPCREFMELARQGEER